MYVAYLPASLSIRMKAADALGWDDVRERCKERLIDLGRDDLAARAMRARGQGHR